MEPLLDVDQLGQVVRQHRLVARDDRNALQQGAFDDVVGSAGVVDHLDDEVDLGVVENLVRRVGEVAAVDRAGLVERAHADLHDLGIGVFRFAHHFVDALPDDAEAEEADFDFCHICSVFVICPVVTAP